MAANHTECSVLEQWSDIIFLVAERSKACENYREGYFSLKVFANGLNMDLSLRA